MDCQPHGSDLTKLTTLGSVLRPTWSPDGAKIAFMAYEGSYNLYMMNADGSNIQRLVSGVSYIETPSFSPDGETLAYIDWRNGSFTDIRVIDLATGIDSQLLRMTNRSGDSSLEYSPDGRFIAWTENTSSGTSTSLMMADADGSNVREVARREAGSIAARWLAWAPDAASIYWEVIDFTASQFLYQQVSAADGTALYGRTDSFASSSRVQRALPSPTGNRFAGILSTNRQIVLVDRDGNTLADVVPTGNTFGSIYDLDWHATDEVVTPDTTAPTISITPPTGTSVVQGGSLNVTYSCSDEESGSGVASCVGTAPSGAALDTSAVGTKTFTVTATDVAGNQATSTATYMVTWPFGGFTGPVNGGSTVNATKAGGVVPVKFSLGGDRGLAILATGYPKSVKVNCATSAPIDSLEEYATVSPGNNTLSYDAASGLYGYNWKTDKSWSNTCRDFIVRLSDGSEYRAKFQFK